VITDPLHQPDGATTVLEDLDVDPRSLTDEEREAWHRAQEESERAWLDTHIRALRPAYTFAA
jgi:hypothetical protein